MAAEQGQAQHKRYHEQITDLSRPGTHFGEIQRGGHPPHDIDLGKFNGLGHAVESESKHNRSQETPLFRGLVKPDKRVSEQRHYGEYYISGDFYRKDRRQDVIENI